MSVNGQYLSEQAQQTAPAPATARMYLEVSPFNSDLSQGHGRYYELSEFLQADNNLSELASAATARQNLGVEIGVDVQAWAANLDTLAGLDDSDSNFIVGSAGGWVVESGATVRTSLGLGTIATVNSPLPIANGGSGQTAQQAAIDALTAVSAATDEYVLTKDTSSGNAIWKAATGGGAALTIQEVDGTPSVANVDTIVVSNGTLTDDGGGQVTIAIGSGSALPVADTTAIVEGSVDDTKLLRFEVDGFTTGTTRVLTPPDADILLAGQDFANTFTAAQTVSLANSQALDVGGYASVQRLYLKENSAAAGANNVFITERPSSGNRRVMIYGPAQSGEFGYVISPTDLTATSVYALLWTKDIDGGATAVSYGGFSISAGGTLEIFTDKTSGGVAGPIELSPDGVRILRANSTTVGIGTSPSVSAKLQVLDVDAVTNSITDLVVLDHRTSGTPVTGFGNGVLFRAKSSTSSDQNMGRLSFLWATATHASRKARGVWSVYDTAEREGMRIEASGTAPMIGFLGAAAIVRQAHIVDPSGGGTQDAEARTAINAILLALENYGLLATS